MKPRERREVVVLTPLDEVKLDVLAKLGKEASFHPFTSNFLNLLVDKARIGQLAAIAEEFEALYCASTDTQVSERPPPRVLSLFSAFG